MLQQERIKRTITRSHVLISGYLQHLFSSTYNRGPRECIRERNKTQAQRI